MTSVEVSDLGDELADVKFEPDDFASKDLPEDQLLWHYTDFAGMKGIVEGKLWASSLPYLNDTAEFRYGVEIALQVLKQELTPFNEHRLALFSLVGDFLTKRYFPHDVFVTSLSLADDDLSQWRAYGGPGVSIAVGFDPKAIELQAARYLFQLHEVKYDNDVVATDVLRQIDELAKEIRETGTTVDPEQLARLMGPTLASILTHIVPRYKHPKFRAEREWRLIRRLPVLEDKPRLQRHFRRSGSLVVPYVEIPLHVLPAPVKVLDEGASAGSPVRAVTLGPSPHPVENRLAVEELIARSGLVLVDVSSSKVPFRNW